jgi:hypothetical protein
MAEGAVIHTGENSPEHVAWKLLQVIASNEKKNLAGMNVNADRAWLLKAYGQCIYTVKTGNLSEELK